jgi:hypothetical protein
MITYSPDQLMELLNWLENQRDEGLTLDEIISGLYAGTLTTGIGTTVSESE